MKVTTQLGGGYAGVETRWFGPTNTRGQRIGVRRSDHVSGNPIKYYYWDHSLNQYGNHALAAQLFIIDVYGEDGWSGHYVPASTTRGYVFARVVKGA